MKDRIAEFGRQGCDVVKQTGLLGLFLCRCILTMVTPPQHARQIIKQLHFIGVRSMLVIVLAGVFTGMVVALQFYDTLLRFGSLGLIGSAVALSLLRELGPVISALMFTGRVGSAICAEVGMMRISEQIDALECMGIDPYRFLLSAKFWAGIISLPLLTALFDVVGIGGGYLVAVLLLDTGQGNFIQGLYSGVNYNDVVMGLVKSFVFAWIIIWICTAQGFLLHRQRITVYGAEGVSKVTTEAVVFSSMCILCADYLIGALML